MPARIPAISVRVTGVSPSVKYLDHVKDKVRNNRLIFRAARREYARMINLLFDSEGGMYGAASWRDLSPLRVAIRGKYDSGRAERPILQWTGTLRKVATATNNYSKTDTGRTNWPDGVQPTTMSYTLQESGMEMHAELNGPKTILNDGGRAGRYFIPAREFWPWNDSTDVMMERVFINAWEDILK